VRVILRICAVWACFGIIAAGQTQGFEMIFVLDVSPSMIGPERFVAEGARLATYELGSGDRVSVVTFSSGIKVSSEFSNNTREIERTFKSAVRSSVSRPGKRRLYDAVFTALEQFPVAARATTSRVIAVITNDVDSSSAHEPSDLIREARSKGVQVWVFLIGNPYTTPVVQQNNGLQAIPYPDVRFAANQLRPIAAATGGDAFIWDMNGYVLRKAIAACKGGSK
jgi:uncharacterized protein (DUF58 family)